MLGYSSNESRTPLRVIAASLATAGVAGGVWHLDAGRRDRESRRLHRMMVEVLLNALTAGDADTGRHSRRVADLTDVVAATYGLGPEERATVRVAALLHDMGKIDDRFFDVLHSCTPLTREQREKIEKHPHQSAHILEPMEEIHGGVMNIVESHHECWDGTGYPRGLKGEEIPLGARIISAADVFDAMTQPRSYREAQPVGDALEEIQRSAGRRFDPAVVARIEQPSVLCRWGEIARAGREAEKAARS